MKRFLPLCLFLCYGFMLNGQVYTATDNYNNTHRYLIDENYFVETVYTSEDGTFVLTRGGFYNMIENQYQVRFEFNSNFAEDSLRVHKYQKDNNWKKISTTDQALEGKWLMAGRVKPEGEQRRDLNRSRKTMKLLLDGHFQWTAFDTASMRFMGSGGGTYTTTEKDYTETLEYFSRDKNKVGKVLPFNYTQKGDDWYHQGLNSKGAPLHEIWHKRPSEQ